MNSAQVLCDQPDGRTLQPLRSRLLHISTIEGVQINIVKAVEADHRDWEEICAWAQTTLLALQVPN
jgi:hypothetical protein